MKNCGNAPKPKAMPVLVMAGAALPMLSNPTQPTYDIACNRSGFADQYWVDIADQLLKEA